MCFTELSLSSWGLNQAWRLFYYKVFKPGVLFNYKFTIEAFQIEFFNIKKFLCYNNKIPEHSFIKKKHVEGRQEPYQGHRGRRGPLGPYRGLWPQGNFSPASIVHKNKYKKILYCKKSLNFFSYFMKDLYLFPGIITSKEKNGIKNFSILKIKYKKLTIYQKKRINLATMMCFFQHRCCRSP